VSRELVRSVDDLMDVFLQMMVDGGFPFNAAEDMSFGLLGFLNGIDRQALTSVQDYIFKVHESDVGWDPMREFRSRVETEQLRVQAIHPIKNASHMKEIHALWHSLSQSKKTSAA